MTEQTDTPSGEIIEFPGGIKSDDPEMISEPFREELHANAFRDMEGEVCDLDRMAEIARDLIMNCRARDDEDSHCLDLASFAVHQVKKMTAEFQANYYKRWHAELKGPV